MSFTAAIKHDLRLKNIAKLQLSLSVTCEDRTSLCTSYLTSLITQFIELESNDSDCRTVAFDASIENEASTHRFIDQLRIALLQNGK